MTRRGIAAAVVLAGVLMMATVPSTSHTSAMEPAQQAPDRSHHPQPGPPPALHLPAIQKRKLSNGIPVWVVERHGVPVAQVTLVISGGASDDPPRQFGLAGITASMLDRGAGTRSALDFSDAVESLGAELRTAAGMDSSVVRLHVPVARLADALALMADVVERPTFPREELDRVRQERLTAILQAHDQPATISTAALSRVLYGQAHRYGTPLFGTADAVKRFTVDEVRGFYNGEYRPDNATLLVVGDVTVDGIVSLLERRFGPWKPSAGQRRHASLPAVSAPSARALYLVDKPGAPQSQIRIGDIGVARATPDYFPIEVMNTILGGSFTSRLNNNLREQHGYAYGAGSGFDMRASAGPFAASAGVQTDKTTEALKEFFNELNGILKPVPAEELEREKNYIALRYPGEFETTGDISRRLEDALIYHLPDDYFSTYIDRIQAVTAANVEQAARAHIHPDRMAVVIVGDLKTIEPGIRSLNLGPIKVMTMDEVF